MRVTLPEMASTAPPVPTRALLVTLEADLPPYRVNGLFCAIRQHPGVATIVDLSMVSQATLDLILRKPTCGALSPRTPFSGRPASEPL